MGNVQKLRFYNDFCKSENDDKMTVLSQKVEHRRKLFVFAKERA